MIGDGNLQFNKNARCTQQVRQHVSYSKTQTLFLFLELLTDWMSIGIPIGMSVSTISVEFSFRFKFIHYSAHVHLINETKMSFINLVRGLIKNQSQLNSPSLRKQMLAYKDQILHHLIPIS